MPTTSLDNGDSDAVRRASDVLTSSQELLHNPHGEHKRMQHQHAMDAQCSHMLMGSGAQHELHARGKRRWFFSFFEPGELYQKIHSLAFIALASVAGTLDLVATWAVKAADKLAVRIWGIPGWVPQPVAAAEQLKATSRLERPSSNRTSTELSPLGTLSSTSSQPAADAHKD